jgi:tetratricopeptide (TPR) repeat protein
MQRPPQPKLPGLGAPLNAGRSSGPNPFELQRMLEEAIGHHKSGRAAEAEQGYQSVLQRAPNQPDALNLLAVLAIEAGNHAAAADLFERAIAVRPKDPVILNNFGNALVLSRRYEEAIQFLEQALALNPDMADAWLNYGRALNQTGRPQDAIAAFGQLRRLKPESLSVHIGVARAHTELGQFAEAEVQARAMIAKAPNSSSGYVSLANMRTFRPGDPEIAAVEALLQNPALSPAERRGLSYAAGKMCDDCGRYDDAHRYYDQANALRGLTYDAGAQERDYDQIVKTYSAAFFAARKGWGSASDRPVFIVGMPRSGTTLVETILGAHPAVFAAGELETVKRLDRTNGQFVYDDKGSTANATALSWFGVELMAKRYLDAIGRKNATARHVTDKMPHNFQNLGLIALMFPNARIVHCRRHPLDTIVSCWMQSFNDGHNYAANLTDAARHYAQYLRLMEHWKKVLPVPIYDIAYEDLVAGQETASRGLLSHLGLAWDERVLQFHTSERTVLTASVWQVRQPIYARSKGRWRNYEAYLAPARAILKV